MPEATARPWACSWCSGQSASELAGDEISTAPLKPEQTKAPATSLTLPGITERVLGDSNMKFAGDSMTRDSNMKFAGDSMTEYARDSIMSKFEDDTYGEDDDDEEAPVTAVRPSIHITESPVSERSAHRERLQKLVKDFARSLTVGMQVTLLVSENGGVNLSQAFLLLDRQATILTLKPGQEGEAEHLDFPVLEISSIYQGTDVCVKCPSLGEHGLHSVGMDINGSQSRFFFYFEDDVSREHFYSCMRIIRMSVDMKGTCSPGTGRNRPSSNSPVFSKSHLQNGFGMSPVAQ